MKINVNLWKTIGAHWNSNHWSSFLGTHWKSLSFSLVSNDYQWFFYDFQWFSLISIDTQRFSMIFKYFHCSYTNFNDFQWAPMISNENSRNPETPRFRDSRISGVRDFGISESRSLGMSGFKNFGISEFRDFGVSEFRDFGISESRSLGVSGFRDFGVSGFSMKIIGVHWNHWNLYKNNENIWKSFIGYGLSVVIGGLSIMGHRWLWVIGYRLWVIGDRFIGYALSVIGYGWVPGIPWGGNRDPGFGS